MCSQVVLWELADFIQITGRPVTRRQVREAEEACECTSLLQKLKCNSQGAKEVQDKKVALQRSHHPVSRQVSWSGSSRQSQRVGFDERFPTSPASSHQLMAGSLHCFLCRANCREFRECCTFCHRGPLVTLHFHHSQHAFFPASLSEASGGRLHETLGAKSHHVKC